jgi:hypothetical protein
LYPAPLIELSNMAGAALTQGANLGQAGLEAAKGISPR